MGWGDFFNNPLGTAKKFVTNVGDAVANVGESFGDAVTSVAGQVGDLPSNLLYVS